MRVIGIAGWSGSGKTTLLSRLIPTLVAGGTSVSTIKHTHHDVDLDRPGKDSFRHREAGAREVLVASGRRWALLHELRDAPEPSLADLLARLAPVDLVVVEGFKASMPVKLEVFRRALGKPPLYPGDPGIAGVASDASLEGAPLPNFLLDDVAAIGAWCLETAWPVDRFNGRVPPHSS